MKKRLDDVVRLYIKARDNFECSTCGIHQLATPQGTLDWSHKITRNNLFLRWDERNSITQCRRCHNDWGNGINGPLNKAIDCKWGEGTASKLEIFSKQNQTIKGTLLDDVTYRIKLEEFYKNKLNALTETNLTDKDKDYIADIIWDEIVNLDYDKMEKN